MKLITLVLVATFLTLSSLCVQGSPEDGLSRWKDQSVQQPADDPLLRWMNKIAQQELQARENAIAQIRTVADAERRKQVVREEILQILGGLPDYNGPLHARIAGRIQLRATPSKRLFSRACPAFLSPPIFTGPINRVAIPRFYFSPATPKRGSRSRRGRQPTWH